MAELTAPRQNAVTAFVGVEEEDPCMRGRVFWYRSRVCGKRQTEQPTKNFSISLVDAMDVACDSEHCSKIRKIR